MPPKIITTAAEDRKGRATTEDGYALKMGGVINGVLAKTGEIAYYNDLEVHIGDGIRRLHKLSIPVGGAPSIVSDKIVFEDATFKLVFKMERSNEVKATLTAKVKPASDTVSFTHTPHAGCTFTWDGGTSVLTVQKAGGVTCYTFPKLTTDSGDILVHSWDVGTTTLSVQIPEPQYSDLGTYPLVIDPTVIDSDGGFVTGINKRWVFQDSAGFFYVIWIETSPSNRVSISSSRDSFATRKSLFDSAGSALVTGAGTLNAATSFTGAMKNDKLYLAVRDLTNNRLLQTTCVDLPNWDLTASWKNSVEGANGFTVVKSGVGGTQSGIDLDEDDNIYFISLATNVVDIVIHKYLRSGDTWSDVTVADPSFSIRGSSVIITADQFVNIAYGDIDIYYKRSTSPKDITSLPAATQVTVCDVNSVFSMQVSMMEEADNKLVVMGYEGGGSFAKKWNYFDGVSWTQGTGVSSGSVTGLPAANLFNLVDMIARDGAKNVYITIVRSDGIYEVLRFNGTGWTSITTVNPGAGDALANPGPEGRIPTAATTCGWVYGDADGTNPDTLVFDTFTVEAAPSVSNLLSSTTLASTSLSSTTLESTSL